MEDDLFGSGSASPSDSENEQVDLRIKNTVLPRFSVSHVPQKVLLARVPAFVAIDASQFDPDKISEDFDDHAVRWRFVRTGNSVAQQSNARIVDWDDGSRTLQVGAEHYELLSKAPPEPVFIAQNHIPQQMLQTSNLVDELLTIIPTSTSSRTHRRLAARLANRQRSRHVRVGNFVTKEDPEKVQRDVERAESMKDKARRKLAMQREEQPTTRQPIYEQEVEEDDDRESELESDAEEEAEDLDSDDLEALDDEAEEANASRLRAAKDPSKRVLSDSE